MCLFVLKRGPATKPMALILQHGFQGKPGCQFKMKFRMFIVALMPSLESVGLVCVVPWSQEILFLPYLALILRLPHGWRGSYYYYIFFYYMEMLDHANFSCLAPFLILPPYAEREKKTSEYCAFAFADGGNRTPAASTASKRAIHYTIAPRHILQQLDT